MVFQVNQLRWFLANDVLRCCSLSCIFHRAMTVDKIFLLIGHT